MSGIIESEPRRSEVSDSPRKQIWIGVVIVGIFFGGFGAWAALAPVCERSGCPGIM